MSSSASTARAARRPSVVAPLLGLGAAVAAFTGLYAVAVCTGRGQSLDQRVWGRLRDLSPVEPHRIAEALGVVTPLRCLAALGVVLVVALLQRRAVPALVGIGCAAGTFLTSEVLKHLLVRPDLGISWLGENSFPSGHTGAIAAVTVAAVVALAGAPRALLGWLGALATLAVGTSVVLAGWHRPSDPVASVLVATCWALAGNLLVRARRHR